eukprot:Opistho-2@3278
MDADTAAALAHLLKAPSKEFVVTFFESVFRHRGSSLGLPSVFVQQCASDLGVAKEDVEQLSDAVHAIIDEALFEGRSAEEIVALFPEGMHKNLIRLITTVVVEHLPVWRAASLANQISLPKLEDFDWRIDIKTASDSLSRMSQPTVLVQMKVREVPTRTDGVPAVKAVNFELNKETLDTMLDGLGKIRDQLSSVAK